MISIFIINSIVVVAIVLIHSQILYSLSLNIPELKINRQFKVSISVLAIITAHVVEVWIFAIVYFLLITYTNLGTLTGDFNGSLMDCSYFSFTSYTSLGIGDIVPSGHIRFLVGLEVLTGLVMITWSASFLYLEMKKLWNKKH
jgi:energy-converting hydrogenase Eha subunit A